MSKILVFLDGPLMLIWAVWATIAWASLKRRMQGLHEPELWLSRKERRAHARKLLAREDEQYRQRLFEEQTEYLNKQGRL